MSIASAIEAVAKAIQKLLTWASGFGTAWTLRGDRERRKDEKAIAKLEEDMDARDADYERRRRSTVFRDRVRDYIRNLGNDAPGDG